MEGARPVCIRRFFSVLAFSTLAWINLVPARGEELVKFYAAVPRSGAGGSADLPQRAQIQGYLAKPRGEGPFPAVVLLHSCLGLPANRRTIAETLAHWGYVALFVDDFTTRGIRQTCAVDFPQGISDAFGALLYLSRLPYVDRMKIGAVGYSQGADVALEIAASRSAAAFILSDNLKFKAAAAFYPPCANEAAAALKIPTLILIGELDNVTPAADCDRLAKSQPIGHSDVKLIVYSGAYHLFDDPSFAGGKRVLGMWLAYNRSAAQKAKSALRAFLAAALAR